MGTRAVCALHVGGISGAGKRTRCGNTCGRVHAHARVHADRAEHALVHANPAESAYALAGLFVHPTNTVAPKHEFVHPTNAVAPRHEFVSPTNTVAPRHEFVSPTNTIAPRHEFVSPQTP
eukprot:364347-Chlamydomonas_euryale.AAC.25